MNHSLLVATFATLAFACTSDPLVLPDPATGASSSSGSGGSGGQGGSGGSGGEAGAGGLGGSGPMAGDSSGSRLRRRVWTSPDGLRESSGISFYDSVLNIDCFGRKVPDGSTRCMPSVPVLANFFKDASCTIPLAGRPKACDLPVYISEYIPSTSQMCGAPPPPVPRVYHVGPAEPAAYYDSSGTCILYPVAAGYEFFALGPQVNYSTFALMSFDVE